MTPPGATSTPEGSPPSGSSNRRRFARLGILALFGAIWLMVYGFRHGGESSPKEPSGPIPVHMTVKGKVGQVESATLVSFEFETRQGVSRPRVRLVALASPPSGPVSEKCREDLERRLGDGSAWVRSLGEDAQGGTLGKLMLVRAGGPPEDLGSDELGDGCAWFCDRAPEAELISSSDRSKYLDQEAQARAAKRGVFADPPLSPPADCSRSAR